MTEDHWRERVEERLDRIARAMEAWAVIEERVDRIGDGQGKLEKRVVELEAARHKAELEGVRQRIVVGGWEKLAWALLIAALSVASTLLAVHLGGGSGASAP